MQNTLFTMQKHISSILIGFLLFALSVPVSAIDDIKGVQPSSLANTLYSKQSGSGYQGTFFIKSPELIEVGNKMLKRSGVQYTLTKNNTRSSLPSYITTEEAIAQGTDAPAPAIAKSTTNSPSFSDINHQVRENTEGTTSSAARQSNGTLFSDVSTLLQQ
jgi:hypothetical protein